MTNQKQTIAVIASNEQAYREYVRFNECLVNGPVQHVWVNSMNCCEGKTFTKVVRTCKWFGEDLLEYCEGRLRLTSHQDFVPVDHSFNSSNVHDDFTVVGGDTCVLLVMNPAGGTQRVVLKASDLEAMINAMS